MGGCAQCKQQGWTKGQGPKSVRVVTNAERFAVNSLATEQSTQDGTVYRSQGSQIAPSPRTATEGNSQRGRHMPTTDAGHNWPGHLSQW